MQKSETSGAWDRCAEDFLIKFATGMASTGVVSAVLFRRPGLIAGGAAFGAGVGTGLAAGECKVLLNKAKERQMAKLKKLQSQMSQ